MATIARPLQTQRSYRRWVKRIAGALAALLLVFAGIIAIAGAKAKADLAAKYPPPGQLVDVGGYKLHIACQGTGSPTVVMDAGLGDFSLIWALVQPEASRITQVCVYDRAGYGWSDRSATPRTAQNIVNELHTLLTRSGVQGPYVLVGHSLGGMHVRLFAYQHPDQVAGLVLVDASHEEQDMRMPTALVNNIRQLQSGADGQMQVLRALAAIGVLAQSPDRFPDIHPQLSVATRETYKAVLASDSRFFATYPEELAGAEESMAQLRAARITSLGTLPVMVIRHGKAEAATPEIPEVIVRQGEQVWQILQGELAAQSTHGRLIVAERSGHYIQLDQPELVVDAIRQVVEAAQGR